MRSSGMGSTPRGAAGSVSPPRWDGLVDKSLFQSQVRNGRAEGSRAQCPGANPGAFSRCELSQGGSPPLGRGTRALPAAGEEARRDGGAGQGYAGDWVAALRGRTLQASRQQS